MVPRLPSASGSRGARQGGRVCLRPTRARARRARCGRANRIADAAARRIGGCHGANRRTRHRRDRSQPTDRLRDLPPMNESLLLQISAAAEPLDLEALRTRLANGKGPGFWRSLEEAAETPAFRALVEREFPSQLPRWDDTQSRRHFLRLMGA